MAAVVVVVQIVKRPLRTVAMTASRLARQKRQSLRARRGGPRAPGAAPPHASTAGSSIRGAGRPALGPPSGAWKRASPRAAQVRKLRSSPRPRGRRWPQGRHACGGAAQGSSRAWLAARGAGRSRRRAGERRSLAALSTPGLAESSKMGTQPDGRARVCKWPGILLVELWCCAGRGAAYTCAGALHTSSSRKTSRPPRCARQDLDRQRKPQDVPAVS